MSSPSAPASVRPVRILALAAVCALSLFVAACGGDAPAPAPSGSPAETGPPPHPGLALKKLPKKLSALGLWESMASREPAAGVRRYEVKEHQWGDGTQPLFDLWLPPKGVMEATEAGEFVFPKGTILARTVLSATPIEGRSHRVIETQVMRKKKKRKWDLLAYVWNDEGTEALLTNGRDQILGFTLEGCVAPYEVTGRVKCTQCHFGTPDFAIGLTSWNLEESFLQELVDAGQLNASLPLAYAEIEGDEVEKAAKSYLSANCSHCHRPGSINYDTMKMDMRHWALADSTVGVLPVRFAHPEAKYVVTKGKPEASILFRALSWTLADNDPNRQMPPVGIKSIDVEGTKKVRAWIEGL